jgi:predicted dehydrogenase
MKRVRIGVIGCGAISADYRLPALREIAEVDIAAVVDADLDRARRTAEQFVVDDYYNDHRKLFGHVDAALVATPNSTHCPISCDLMAHGIHVLCEKPMAVTTDECSRMIKVRDEAGVKFMVGHTMRFYEILEQAKHFIGLGALGKIRRLEVQCGGVFGWPTRSGFYFDKSRAGGGVIIDLGCHLFDLSRWLLGEELSIVSVQAEDKMNRGVEDEASICAVSKSGTEIVLGLSRNRSLGNDLRVEGEKGSLSCNIYGKGLSISATGLRLCGQVGKVIIQQPRGGSPYFHEMSHFVSCLLNGALPMTSAESSSVAVDLVQECYHRLGLQDGA